MVLKGNKFMGKELNLLFSLLSVVVGFIVLFFDSDYSFIYFLFFILLAVMFFRHCLECDNADIDRANDGFKTVSSDREYVLPSIDILGKRVKYRSKGFDEVERWFKNMFEVLGIKASTYDIVIGALSIRGIVTFDSVMDASKFLEYTREDTIENYDVIEVRNVVGKKNTVEIIFANNEDNVCVLRNCINGRKNGKFELFVGEEDNGKSHVIDLFKHNSIMITGLNNDEIGNLMNSMIVSLLMKHTPADLGLILINNGNLDFTEYNGVPHLVRPMVTDDNESLVLLREVVKEVNRRKDISNGFCDAGFKKLVLFINDLDYMVYSKNEEYLDLIQYIIRYGGDAGIYLVCSSNYIDDDESDDLIVICDCIVAFRHDSDALFNKYRDTCIDGCAFIYYKDMLDYDLIRIAPSFVSDSIINNVVDYWRKI